jgi:hypothetical protein
MIKAVVVHSCRPVAKLRPSEQLTPAATSHDGRSEEYSVAGVRTGNLATRGVKMNAGVTRL